MLLVFSNKLFFPFFAKVGYVSVFPDASCSTIILKHGVAQVQPKTKIVKQTKNFKLPEC